MNSGDFITFPLPDGKGVAESREALEYDNTETINKYATNKENCN